MIVKALSDTHGSLPNVGKFDLLLICGDVCPVNNHTEEYQVKWFKNEFKNWIQKLEYIDEESMVVMIPGNHDFLFDGIKGLFRFKEMEQEIGSRIKILNNNEYIFNNKGHKIKIFGTPYCKVFGNWAFMRIDSVLKDEFDKIPDDVDILITHDAPHINDMGTVLENCPWKGEDASNHVLADAIYKHKPKMFFCGHIHSGNHNFEKVDGMWCANVSYKNEQYKPVNDILEFDYDSLLQQEEGNTYKE